MPSMPVLFFDAAPAFQQAVSPALLQAEAENNLLLGLIDKLASRHPQRCLYNAEPAVMLAVTDEQDQSLVLGAAVMTPPHRLILSRMPDAALRQLSAALHRGGIAVPGANGPDQTVAAFARHWQALSGRAVQLERGLCIYQLDQVALSRRSPGSMRLATTGDLPLLEPWAEDFDHTTTSHSRDHCRQLIEDRQTVLWQDAQGSPVAMAAWMMRTRTGVRIGNVYTPPPQRGRGYASSLVAALSQRLLDEGRRFCFLYTEADNPTSNHIYQVIGYRLVCRCQEWRLS